MTDELLPHEHDALARWTIVQPPAGFADRVVAAHARRTFVRRAALAGGVATALAAAAVVTVIVTRPPQPRLGPPPAEPQVFLPPSPPPQPQPPQPVPQPQPRTTGKPGMPSIPMGETATIHDVADKPRLEIRNTGVCPNLIVAELARDHRFKDPITADGTDSIPLELEHGTYAYRVRCEYGGPIAASGRLRIVRDNANRKPAPKAPDSSTVFADGRSYRIGYQSTVPRIKFSTSARGKRYDLHVVASTGLKATYQSPTHNISVGGMKEGSYSFWFDVDGKRETKVTTLIIDFDQTAPQLYIDTPTTWPPTVDVRGAALPGWSLSIDGADVPVQDDRRFAARVELRDAVVLRAVHPQRGVHYYVRHAPTSR
jgi:hypothetical protein